MTVFTLNFPNPLPVMAFSADLHECFALIFTGSVTIRTIKSFACDVGLIGKFDIVMERYRRK
ncbi:MAG TPA: hypothetical protein VK568_03790 [Thermodesulfobacteriota bacterium]|nr:hypothetical protein [Thermodesulfobacteriota bacterium]